MAHEGRAVRSDPARGDRRPRAPLAGIVSDPARNDVLVFLEDGPGGSLAYDIENAGELRRDSSDRGLRLEIFSGDGSTTIVECHPAGHKASLETLLEGRVT